MHLRQLLVGHDGFDGVRVDDRKDFVFRLVVFNQLLGDVLEPTPSATAALAVEVKQRHVRNVEPLQQPPKVVYVPAAERHD